MRKVAFLLIALWSGIPLADEPEPANFVELKRQLTIGLQKRGLPVDTCKLELGSEAPEEFSEDGKPAHFVASVCPNRSCLMVLHPTKPLVKTLDCVDERRS